MHLLIRRKRGYKFYSILFVFMLTFMCVLYSNTCRSMNGVYFICHLPPYYDGILTDPRDLRPCPQCCQPEIGEFKVHQTSPEIRPGGYFKPRNCTARERVAIIVPYRDREKHLEIFLNYMHEFLQSQQLEYAIYVVEPALPTKFNRGVLVNIGVQVAMKSDAKFTCYVIHDVDLLPTDHRNLYVCSDSPRHMSSANSKFDYKLPYFEYAGGVISFTPEQFQAINGFSNVFFGWGGEDDDLRRRISLAGYTIHRVPFDLGVYKALDHGEDKHNPINPDRYSLMDYAMGHRTNDGLNSLKYELLTLDKRRLYTWVYVALNESDYAIQPSSSSSIFSS